MRESILKNTVKTCCGIFCLLIAVHAFEAIVLRMDETFFGENFINKLFGIFVLWLTLRALRWKWRDVGFTGEGLGRGIARGFSLAAVVFAVAYVIEIVILKTQSNTVRVGFFTMGFSLTGEAEVHRGVGFILMCVFFNVINVIMEEGTFRGLFYEIIRTNHAAKTAALIQALLFGIWHVVTPLHNLIDGDIDFVGFVGLSVGYIILAGLMGIKWSLMYRMTGNLYAGMADHFFNNCIATNLLHLSTESGTDEWMIVRVLIAQLLSFAIWGRCLRPTACSDSGMKRKNDPYSLSCRWGDFRRAENRSGRAVFSPPPVSDRWTPGSCQELSRGYGRRSMFPRFFAFFQPFALPAKAFI